MPFLCTSTYRTGDIGYAVCATVVAEAITSIYGRYWYIGMARVPHMRNTNMHGKISAKTERLAVKGCYYYYSAVSLSNKPKNLTRNHR